MRALLAILALAVTSFTLTACAPSPFADDWIEPRGLEHSTQNWRPPRLDAEPSRDATARPPGQPRAPSPTGELTLRDAVALALLHSPDLASFAWDVRAAEARALQAGLAPNPRVGYGVENFGPDGDDRFLRQTLRISQVIELAGKREKRVQLARAERRLQAWDYEAARLDVITRVAQRHIAVVAAQQRVELVERTLKLVEQVYEIVDQRVQAGVVAAAERDKSAVRVSLERINVHRARHTLAAARQALTSTWAGGEPTFARAVGELDQPLPVPDDDALLALAQDHPRLARWDDEIVQRRAAIQLAKADGVPDVTAGAGVRHFPDAGDAAGVVELSVPLPLIDRNQGRVLEARYTLAAVAAQKASAEASMRADLAAAHADLAAAVFALRTLQDETLPAARRAFAAARDSFQNGRTDYLDVLDAERTLVDVERQLIDAREAHQAAAARLEGLTASPLQRAE